MDMGKMPLGSLLQCNALAALHLFDWWVNLRFVEESKIYIYQNYLVRTKSLKISSIHKSFNFKHNKILQEFNTIFGLFGLFPL